MANNREISQFAGLITVNDTTNAVTIGSTLSVSGDLDVNSGGVYYNSTNNRLGINTTSADQNLHVYGNSSTTFVSVGDQTRVAPYGYFGTDADAGKVSLVSRSTHPLTFQVETSEVGRFDTSGRLLVGTSSGTAKLEVLTSSNGDGIRLDYGNTPTGTTGPAISFAQYNNSNSVVTTSSIKGILTGGAVGSEAGALTFNTSTGGAAPTERMRIDSDGFISINGDTNTGFSQPSGDHIAFTTGGTERMRINSAGRIGISRTYLALDANVTGIMLAPNETSYFYANDATALSLVRNGGSNGQNILEFRRGSGSPVVGRVTVTTSSTAYVTSSDYRLKENVVALTAAADRLNQLQVHRFNFIENPDAVVDGFIAHEVQDIVPEAILGEKDEVDADGNPVYQGIDQSKLVPLLTAALQEALAKIETLEARLTAAGI